MPEPDIAHLLAAQLRLLLLAPLQRRATLFDALLHLLDLKKLMIRREVVRVRLLVLSDERFDEGLVLLAVVDCQEAATFGVFDPHHVSAVQVVVHLVGLESVLICLDCPLLTVLTDVGLVPRKEIFAIAPAKR